MLFSIVGFIDNEQKFFFSLKAYVLMSIVGLFIAYYAYFFDKIPFIFLIRSYGFDAARSLHYINVNSNYVRLAGSFYDPNFYGIYLFSVIIFSGWLYKYSRGSKFYLILIGISIVTLLLTVSRTALIGLGIAYMFFIALDAEHKRAHLKGMGMLLAIVVIDYAAGLPMLLKFQPKPPLAIVVNHATNSSMSRQFQSKPKPDKAIVADHPASLPIPFQFQSRPHETIVPPYVASPPIRWFNTRSVMLRLPFYKVGWKAFKSNVLFGGGLIALFNPTSGTATAHMAYLSLLGKYGLFGTMIYLIFIFYPVGYIYFHRQNMHARYRNLVVYIFAPLAMMYFSYDFLSFLEFEYFLFAIGYVIVIYNFSIRPHPQMALTHIDHIEKTYEYGINSPKRPAKMADTPAVSGKNGILQSYLLLAIGYTLIMYGFSLIHVHG
jgi:hypothetical protein